MAEGSRIDLDNCGCVGTPVLGWVLGFFLGVIGLVIVACVPAKKPAAPPQPGSAV